MELKRVLLLWLVILGSKNRTKRQTHLPILGALVLLPELLFELSETLRYFVDGFVKVAVFVVLRVEIFFVAAALFARHNRLVLQRVLSGSVHRFDGRVMVMVRYFHHVLGR